MRWAAVALLVVPLAGCIDAGPDVPYGVMPLDFADGCPLLYPDGTPWSCDENHLGHPGTVPELSSDWRCAAAYNDDGDTYHRYDHPDGRYGGRFVTTPQMEGSVPVLRVLVNTEDRGYAAVATHAPDAFVALEEPVPDVRHDVYLTLREFRMFVRGPGEPAFRLAGDDATIHVGKWNGIDWYAWRIELGGRTAYIDLMVPDADDDEYLQWGFRTGEYMLPDGTEIVTDMRGAGIKYLGQGETSPTQTINEALRFC